MRRGRDPDVLGDVLAALCALSTKDQAVRARVPEGGARFDGAQFSGAGYNRLVTVITSFHGARFNGAPFDGVRLNGTSYNGARYNDTSFKETEYLLQLSIDSDKSKLFNVSLIYLCF